MSAFLNTDNERSSVIGSALVVKVGAIAPARRTLPRNRLLAFINLLFIAGLFGSSKSSCYLSRENSTPLQPVCLVASVRGQGQSLPPKHRGSDLSLGR